MKNEPDEDILVTLCDINATICAALRDLHEDLGGAITSLEGAPLATAQELKRVSRIAKQLEHWVAVRDLVVALPLQLSPDSILERVDASGKPSGLQNGDGCMADKGSLRV